jgi:hypothetical protein
VYATYRRHGLVLALVALTGLASVAAGVPERTAPLPPIAGLVARSGWSIMQQAPAVSYPGSIYVVAEAVNTRGAYAQIYEGAESVQKMLHWSGELGFAGDGYVASRRGVALAPLENGRSVGASYSIEQSPTDRQFEEYAVVAPGYIAAHSTDHLLTDTWDVIRGRSGPYFVVRIAIRSSTPTTDAAARANASQLLGHILTRLSATARAEGSAS